VTSAAAQAVRPTNEELAFGERIRRARAARELTLAELAELAGVSKSLISQIERGRRDASLDTVRKVASALQVPVFSLFVEEADTQMVVRRDQRRIVRYPGSRATREILSPGLHGRMVLVWVTFPPEEDGRPRPVRHVGEECVVVIRGALEVLIGEQTIRLERGDSMTFNPEVPHLFRNPTDDATEIIAAISPPNI